MSQVPFGQPLRLRRRARYARAAAVAAIAAAGLTACGGLSGGGSDGEDSNPFAGQNLTWIVPAAPGGGFDGTTRELQPYIAEQLDTNIAVVNKAGGQFAIGARDTLNAGDDCYTIMTHADPHLLFSYLTQDVGYTYDDFHPIMSLKIQPVVIRVRDDAKWRTLQDLVQDARANPGTIRMSVSGLANNNYVSVYQIEQATGAKFNIVPFDGGGPAREALLAGHVDVTDAGVFNSLGIAEGTRVLAVQQDENRWRDITDNAPTVNEALGTSLPPNSSEYGVFVTKSCYENHPDRYRQLVKAFQTATQNEDYRAKLEEVDELAALDIQDAETFDAEIRDDLKRLNDLIENDPNIFQQGG